MNTFFPAQLITLPPGTRFMIDEETPAIYIGPGGFRKCETVPLMAGDREVGSVEQLKFFSTDSFVLTYWYKTEWHIIDLSAAILGFGGFSAQWSLGWTPEVEEAVLLRKKYI